MKKILKLLLLLLFFIIAALYYTVYTASGRHFCYNILSFVLTQKVHLQTKITDINLTNYPYMTASLRIEDIYQLNIDGYYQESQFDMHYTLNSHCIESSVCKVNSDLHIEGDFKGPKKHIRITGKGTALDGNISYSGIKERHAFHDINIDVQEINSTKLFTLLGQKALFNGKANAFMHFDTLSKQRRKGMLSYAVRDTNYHGLDVNLSTHIDIDNEKHTFTMFFNTPTATLTLLDGKYNQDTREASAIYTLDIENIKALKSLLKVDYDAPFYSVGTLSYAHKQFALQGVSKSLGGMLDFVLKDNKLHFYLQKIPLSPLLAHLHTDTLLQTDITGKGVYDLHKKTLHFDARLDKAHFTESHFTRSIRDKYHINLVKEIFDNSHIHIKNVDNKILTDLYLENKTNHLHAVDTYINSKNSSIQSKIDLKMANYYLKGNLFLKIDKYTSANDTFVKFKGTIQKHYHLTLKGLINSDWVSMDYMVNAKRFPSHICTIVDDVNASGHINGSLKQLHIKAEGTALNGKFFLDTMHTDHQFEDFHLKLKNIHAKKLSTLLGYPEFPYGKATINTSFGILSENIQEGKIDYTLQKAKLFALPLSSNGYLKLHNQHTTFDANITLKDTHITLTKGHINKDKNTTKAFYTIDVKALHQLKELLGYTYHGTFYAMGTFTYHPHRYTIQGLSKSFGGMTEFHYDGEKLDIALSNASLKSIMQLFPYPPFIDASTTGKVVYDFTDKKLSVHTKLKNAKFLYHKVMDTIYQKSDVNMLKETFTDATLSLTYHNNLLLANLLMQNAHSHLFLKQTQIDTKLNTIHAYFDIKMQKKEFSGKLYGNLEKPKIDLNLQKLIRHEMDKKLDAIMGEGNRKMMQNMPMGGVAEDMASGMGGAFMGIFF